MVVPRPDQIEAFECAKRENTIVNMETGSGKTLIAALAIQHYLVQKPEQRVLFIVPTRALVRQQSDYLRNNVRVRGAYAPSVAEVAGFETDSWTHATWAECLEKHQVVVGTAEIFRFALCTAAFITPSQFSLMVFDECHNATGNSPMAATLRYLYHPPTPSPPPPRLGGGGEMRPLEGCGGEVRPRLLGLTASFLNGRLGGGEQFLVQREQLVKKRVKLEELFQATMISPQPQEGGGVPRGGGGGRMGTSLYVSPGGLGEELSRACQEYIEQVLLLLPPPTPKDAQDRVRMDMEAVLGSLGAPSLLYYVREGLMGSLPPGYKDI